ncbi:MAG TPA: hydrogenase maturation protease [Acidobacteriaceae bacterium]|nr:hydrogenase maturation protease [Acidobacteriaceae bacterium]
MSAAPAVLLACGNPLRQDDGVGWRIAETVERMADRGFPESRLQIIAVQQWTPELAEHLAGAELAIFVDASAVDEPGAIRVREVSSPTSVKAEQSGSTRFRLAQARTWGRRAEVSETHGLEPAELMALAERVCGHAPARAFVLTVGGEWFQYGEEISRRVQQSVPRAVRLVGNLVAAFAEAA